MARIERHVGCAGHHHGEDRAHHLRGTLDADANQSTGGETFSEQLRGQRTRIVCKLSVTPQDAAALERDAVRLTLGAGEEGFMDRLEGT